MRRKAQRSGGCKIKSLFIIFLLGASTTFAEADKKTVKELTHFTRTNLKGHKAIYNEGWLIIPSTKKSLDYSYKKTVLSAKEAWIQTLNRTPEATKRYKEQLKNAPEKALKINKYLWELGKDSFKYAAKTSDRLIKAELKYANQSFHTAWDKILLGSIYFTKRSRPEINQIKELTSDLPDQFVQDYKNLKAWATFLRSKKKHDINVAWGEAIDKASEEFTKEYKKSGKKSNTLKALPFVVWGNIKALWYGLFKPVGEEINNKGSFITKKALKWTGRALLFPVAEVVMLTGRTVYSLGGALYYTGKIGLNIVADTIEGGLLAAMGVLSTASTVPTFIVGNSIGFVNQVALSASGISAGLGHYTLATSAATANYVGRFVYDMAKGTGQVLVGSATSGIVLGYNAMTALPAQMFLGIVNGVAFLAWDGPRLLIAFAKGDIKASSLEDTPIGSVLDLKKLKESGIEVQTISEDPAVIKEVIKALPMDLR